MDDRKQPQWIVAECSQPIEFSESYLTTLEETYPDVDVIGQLNAAADFAEVTFDTPLNKRGVVTFVNNWLKRNQRWAERNADKFRVCTEESKS
ncbi:hypothetical protein [Salinisphaera sp. G21_0]|uniref:hypothetical protein n=1 Tax=Salinisphaera sp. G21_0 TaxID=2821094 RepID=UPI001ADBA869|nr:hypothetical protein [Salinisphaera sp. G21_0]MBO9484337.1 hypothetical protein [Salinisphaera sp. G21_0]